MSSPEDKLLVSFLSAILLLFVTIFRKSFHISFCFLQYTTISNKDVVRLRSRYEELLRKIRPNTVGLVDAFDIIDEVSADSVSLTAFKQFCQRHRI